MKHINLSIIIPIYNVEKYLNDCLNSILETQHNDWEIILVNDGSTDSSLNIAEQYREKNNNINIISQDNKGLSAARNAGIEVAIGKYLFFLDSDDYIDVKELEKMVDIALINDLDLLSGECSVMMDKNNQLTLIEKIKAYNVPKNTILNYKEFLLYQLQKKTFQTIVVMNIYKSSIIKVNNLYFLEGFLHEDEEWTPKVILHCNKIMSVNNNFYFYRKRENSITTKKKNDKNFDDLKIIRDILREMYIKKINNKKLLKLLLDDLVKRKIYDYAICENLNAIEEKKFFINNTFSIKNKINSYLIMYFPKLYFYLRKLK